MIKGLLYLVTLILLTSCASSPDLRYLEAKQTDVLIEAIKNSSTALEVKDPAVQPDKFPFYYRYPPKANFFLDAGQTKLITEDEVTWLLLPIEPSRVLLYAQYFFDQQGIETTVVKEGERVYISMPWALLSEHVFLDEVCSKYTNNDTCNEHIPQRIRFRIDSGLSDRQTEIYWSHQKCESFALASKIENCKANAETISETSEVSSFFLRKLGEYLALQSEKAHSLHFQQFKFSPKAYFDDTEDFHTLVVEKDREYVWTLLSRSLNMLSAHPGLEVNKKEDRTSIDISVKDTFLTHTDQTWSNFLNKFEDSTYTFTVILDDCSEQCRITLKQKEGKKDIKEMNEKQSNAEKHILYWIWQAMLA